jgi:hypothetical protein
MELQYIYEGTEKGTKNNVGIKLLSQKSMNYVERTINYTHTVEKDVKRVEDEIKGIDKMFAHFEFKGHLFV